MTDLEYEQLVAGTPCPNCGENLDIRNVTKTIEVSTFGNLGRKMGSGPAGGGSDDI